MIQKLHLHSTKKCGNTGSNDRADAITVFSIFKVTILISIRLRDAGILSVVLWVFMR